MALIKFKDEAWPWVVGGCLGRYHPQFPEHQIWLVLGLKGSLSSTVQVRKVRPREGRRLVLLHVVLTQDQGLKSSHPTVRDMRQSF